MSRSDSRYEPPRRMASNRSAGAGPRLTSHRQPDGDTDKKSWSGAPPAASCAWLRSAQPWFRAQDDATLAWLRLQFGRDAIELETRDQALQKRHVHSADEIAMFAGERLKRAVVEQDVAAFGAARVETELTQQVDG